MQTSAYCFNSPRTQVSNNKGGRINTSGNFRAQMLTEYKFTPGKTVKLD